MTIAVASAVDTGVAPSVDKPLSGNLIQRLIATEAGWAASALRSPVGIIFAAHGAQKLFGWFGGCGLQGTGQWMASIGLEPGYLMALLAGGAGRASVDRLLAGPRV